MQRTAKAEYELLTGQMSVAFTLAWTDGRLKVHVKMWVPRAARLTEVADFSLALTDLERVSPEAPKEIRVIDTVFRNNLKQLHDRPTEIFRADDRVSVHLMRGGSAFTAHVAVHDYLFATMCAEIEAGGKAEDGLMLNTTGHWQVVY